MLYLTYLFIFILFRLIHVLIATVMFLASSHEGWLRQRNIGRMKMKMMLLRSKHRFTWGSLTAPWCPHQT